MLRDLMRDREFSPPPPPPPSNIMVNLDAEETDRKCKVDLRWVATVSASLQTLILLIIFFTFVYNATDFVYSGIVLALLLTAVCSLPFFLYVVFSPLKHLVCLWPYVAHLCLTILAATVALVYFGSMMIFGADEDDAVMKVNSTSKVSSGNYGF